LTSFGERLAASFQAHGQLCVGIDPHPWLLADWKLADSAAGAREFGLRVVDAAASKVGTVKPQVAFFERFGSAGYSALEDVISEARSAGLLVIADAKRGDVGTSVDAYAQAWLSPGSPLEADAMTANAFQGLGALAGMLELAEANGKGVFVLGATSNPEGTELQQAKTAAGATVAQSITDDIIRWNDSHGTQQLGSIGLVLGATIQASDYGIDLEAIRRVPILAPGFGHQGAKIDQFAALYGPAAGSVLVSVSRSILQAGPSGIAEAIREQATEVAACRA
jgi:orotidine-5'-phosphate decarboxylase